MAVIRVYLSTDFASRQLKDYRCNARSASTNDVSAWPNRDLFCLLAGDAATVGNLACARFTNLFGEYGRRQRALAVPDGAADKQVEA
jgi:hypothetical protein